MNRPVCTVSILAFLASLAGPSQAADVAGDKAKTGELKPFDRAPVHPPKDTPDAAKKNLAKAKIPAGFTADIWASEPLLANPVAFCFDPQGRMFVSETHRYRSSVLDIRHYMFMLEDDLAARNQDQWLASIKKNFPKDWQQLEKESEVIRLVEDSNGDGKADKTSVYAEGFNSALDGIASGVLWDNGSLYFTNIPALWKLSGKDKAEKREELHRGYGVRFSYTGHDFHGLAKGPDGRIYFSIGDRGASVKTKEGGTIEVPDEGAVFRCEPDGTKLELVMRGLRNPQELAFDDFGNLFTGDNDSDQGDRERWVYVVEGGDAGWRIGWQHHPLGKEFNPWLAEHMWEPRDAKKKQPAFILSPIANLPDGPSGLVHYPGTGLPAEYAGSFFLAGYKGSTAKSNVSTFKSVPDGAGFKLEGLRTFIDNIQATDVDFGPDSRFYVSAWDEGWERSDQGRIYRLSHEAARKEQAAQIAEVQKILAEGFAKRSDEELAALLGHFDQRVRLNAQWLLAERRVAAVLLQIGAANNNSKWTLAERLASAAPLEVEKVLMKTIREGAGIQKRLARLHAIWASAQSSRVLFQSVGFKAQQAYPADSAAQAIFTDPDPEIRSAMLRSYSDWEGAWDPKLREWATAQLADPAPRVRFFAATALAKKGRAQELPAIVNMLRENDGKDQYLQHAGVMALAHCANGDALATTAKDPNRHVRLAAVLAATKKV
jgi:quinoprotein glucose dehydrogenase